MNEPVRFSNLKQFAKSPAHYRAAISARIEPTPAMRLGTLVHGLVLGGEGAPVIYEGERRGNAWKDFQAANPGREIVTAGEVAKAVPIADAVMADPVAGPLLRAEGAALEGRIDWTISGRACRGTPDYFDPSSGVLLDLKTTSDASVRGFASQAWRMAYHAQLAWYRGALRELGHEVTSCLLVAVETGAPHGVTVHRLSERALQEGERAWRSWWEQLRVCEAADVWPGYAEAVVDLDVPAWLQEEDDEGQE